MTVNSGQLPTVEEGSGVGVALMQEASQRSAKKLLICAPILSSQSTSPPAWSPLPSPEPPHPLPELCASVVFSRPHRTCFQHSISSSHLHGNFHHPRGGPLCSVNLRPGSCTPAVHLSVRGGEGTPSHLLRPQFSAHLCICPYPQARVTVCRCAQVYVCV